MTLADITNVTKIEIPVNSIIDSLLNITQVPSSFSHNFTVVEGFDRSKGKFAETLGNVALIDCKYANKLLSSTYTDLIEELLISQPAFYVILAEVDRTIKQSIKDVNFCDYALNVYGVLEDQVGSYIIEKEEMERSIGQAGNLITTAITVDNNLTISTPLK